MDHLHGNIYKLDIKYPARGFCFVLQKGDRNVEEMSNNAFRLVNYLCQNAIPHNIFVTFDNSYNLRIYVFPRERKFEEKELSGFNIAFCELSGFVPVGSKIFRFFF